MKKLYIPTSSLNFNNIMSSESVSPVAFYSRRNFGYKIFEKVELNCFENSILLYEKFPDYQIPKSDLVNFPMIIEVDVSDIENDGLKELKNGIWQYDRTIYLNPFSSKIFFITEEHKNTIISRSESSAETKLVKLYSNNIFVFQNEKTKYNLKSINDLPNVNMVEVESDIKKNRLKGFAYSYIIAANWSLSKKTVKIKNTVNKISNLSSAIVNSATGNATKKQEDDLLKLLQSLDYFQYGDVKDYLKSVLPNNWEDVWENLYFRFGLRKSNMFSFEKQYHFFVDKMKYADALEKLNDWCRNIENENKESKTKFEWKNIAIAGNKLTQYEDTIGVKQKTREIYQNLINEVFITTDVTESSFSSERSRLADDITIKIKSYFGNDWDNSEAKKYLNLLRKNLAGQEEFNIKWDTGLISAIGAFILKGEDFEKLNNFLVSNEIEDGRLAFGLYGCICGFANLSRLFTADFYSTDIQYIADTYKVIHKQLHNIDLQGELPKKEIIKPVINYPQSNNKESEENTIIETPKIIKEVAPECPQCSSPMVLREHAKGSFYGCPNYRKAGCEGKRDLDFNELDNKFKIIKTTHKATDKYVNLILEHLNKNSPCRISDLNKYLSSKSNWSYNVSMAKDFLGENLADKVKFEKIGKAEGVELRKDTLL